jgi:hypothetical protein
MTIKQQGGVFGRHPTFSTLDVEASATVDGDFSVDGSTFNVNSTNNRVGVGTANPSALFDVAATSGASIQVRNTGTAASTLVAVESSNNSIYTRGVSSSTGRNLYLKQGVTNSVLFDTSHNVHALLGNIVIGTSGNGIDFSATSGTGTSELLDDYEEGTWTPAFSAEWTTAPSVTSAQYTKIGRQVTVTMLASGGVVTAGGSITGLPFASNASQGAGAYGGNSDTTEILQGTVGQSASSITNMLARS